MREYVLIDWDNLTWTYIDLTDPEAMVYGTMTEPTFAKVKESAWAEGIAVSYTLAVVRGDSVAVCRAKDTMKEVTN